MNKQTWERVRTDAIAKLAVLDKLHTLINEKLDKKNTMAPPTFDVVVEAINELEEKYERDLQTVQAQIAQHSAERNKSIEQILKERG